MEAIGRFAIRTYGCQMNVHDSEKVANLLHHAGYEAARGESDADLLVINTCSIREKAEHHLYSDLGVLRAWKSERPGRVLGVGGCVAQRVGDSILARFPQVDFVFGTHNVRHVAAMAAAATRGERSARTQETRSHERFELPERHPSYAGERPGRAFLTVMEGCDMFCSFCIVPLTRGREISRSADEIVREAEQLVGCGMRELTLLGQTVNAYGRHELRREGAGATGTIGFAELLARIDRVPGIERIRYTSPHPLFFDEALIRAHGELEHLCPHVHLPLQSGSNAVLASMRRRYTRERYRQIVEGLRAARSEIAITTDIIVGFPGERDADFRDTLSLVEEIGFVDQYTFKYSARPGTPAADREDGVPPAVAQDRFEELQRLQRGLTLAYHRSRVGRATRILIDGPSRRGGNQICGRDPFHRVVNLDASVKSVPAAPGDLLDVQIVDATPHSLIGESAASRPGASLARIEQPVRSALPV